MAASDIQIRDLYARLNTLHTRERELNLRLCQEISAALAHYGPNIQALDSAVPLDANFITLYYQLALRRIGQFRREIAERTYFLNRSHAVQEALRVLHLRIELQCYLDEKLDHDTSRSREGVAQQISMAFLHLRSCSVSLQHQLTELMHSLETWVSSRTDQHCM
ncbi:hypothetical protein [Comamonas testosteroni]|uniref:hypothetical protein n=1 Tax=Comamonas testosteroni TaxID=285 RepID=UPI0003663B90|nr:hypothetical protein [Comamonas testosteroni]